MQLQLKAPLSLFCCQSKPFSWTNTSYNTLEGGASVSGSRRDVTQWKSAWSCITGGDWPRASSSLLTVKCGLHWGEEGLTESGVVKHYGDVQIRNSQEKISCSVTHANAQKSTRRQTHTQTDAHTDRRTHGALLCQVPELFLRRTLQRINLV